MPCSLSFLDIRSISLGDTALISSISLGDTALDYAAGKTANDIVISFKFNSMQQI